MKLTKREDSDELGIILETQRQNVDVIDKLKLKPY